MTYPGKEYYPMATCISMVKHKKCNFKPKQSKKLQKDILIWYNLNKVLKSAKEDYILLMDTCICVYGKLFFKLMKIGI